MLPPWIDNQDYVGASRRKRRAAFRMIERRRRQSLGSQPALNSILRQLRMTDLTFADEAKSRRFRLRLGAAATLAARAGEISCTAELKSLMRAFDRTPAKRAIAALAADSLTRALAHLH